MKFAKVFVLVFSLFAIHFSLFTGRVAAQVPNRKVPCNETDTPEFHSLRPYQASATCQTETAEYAKFCGNTLTLQDTIDVTYQPKVDNCSVITGGKIRCNYIKLVNESITINLSGANLPIMGNTEEVTNYKGEADQLTDAQKVNEYVSWYLNGVINRKEYPPTEDNSKIINYSGPINKLLPAEILEASRSETVKSAGISRHNQVVGCIDLLGLGGISACDSNNILQKKVRLSAWENNLPPERSKFTSSQDYRIAYQRWRGDACIKIFGLAFCLDVPWKPNWPGNLFSYIPLSSTEDLEGNIKVDSVSAGGAGVTNVKFDSQKPATLFFSHIQESDELGSILQDTYIGKGQEKIGADTAVAPASSCNTVDVRSNKGDNLFAKSLSGDLSYTASFSCDFNPPSCNTKVGNYCNKLLGTCVQPNSDWTCMIPLGQKDCPSGYTCKLGCFCNPPTQTCSKTVSIALSTTSNTPKIDDVWSRLVAGPTAIVKRMFPKLGAQIGTLKDLPGSTSVSYTGAQSSSGELNFPHIGGISEYFLKGIQTILRPKGYGEQITFGKVDNGQEKLDQCKYTMAQINTAMQQAAKKYQVLESLLRAIFEIEAAEFLLNPDSYICKENSATAAGPMQITRGAYQYVTCENERYEKDADSSGGICKSEGDKLSRCDVNDNFELAARTLLWKAGKIADCNATGPMPTDKMSIYNAACKYYGSFAPDALTVNYAKGIPASERRQNGNMNYCDIVCHKVGLCPPYP